MIANSPQFTKQLCCWHLHNLSKQLCVACSQYLASKSVVSTQESHPRPDKYPVEVLWHFDNCKKDEDGGPPSKPAPISLNSSLSRYPCQSADPRNGRNYYQSTYPTQWKAILPEIEQQQLLLTLCSNHWKAKHVLGQVLKSSKLANKVDISGDNEDTNLTTISLGTGMATEPQKRCQASSFFSGINLLNAMELSPDFSPGLPSPPVLEFIKRIEHADPHSSDFDKDNHDKYLSNILDLLWAAWKTARGPISKGKASSDLSLSSTLCWTVLIISSTTLASMAPPSSVSTVSALTILASVAASVLPISQVTAGDSDSPNEEECCAEFQTLKKNELIEWIKTSGVTVSNLKQRNKKDLVTTILALPPKK
ncbi:hypothetical protein SERLADRAFT_410101 [Serpula lacrymans var. lacrymans S7.9]|uniref:Uncharacterized protein n=1 Tax=Serpula lacrymans var. lacrymans (strain S7.9) TaxID=578457 RepID=F8P4A2_SERL9|nr:uncharacterized protein SERLADRAFT_410101 [Serpula lacrymans var. lacrymans S7.9]EGO21440.1 hypothetical protein SERLADRAFT_410101 [Serpula lacrymans var. lacrymans S7.9]